MPASAPTNSSDASSHTSGRLRRREKRSSTCAASFSRSRPLSTKMHVRRSPMARWTSSAATVESTPPLNPHTTLPPGADLLPNPRGRLVGERGHRPVAAAAADPGGEVGEDACAMLGMCDLGMKQQGIEAARGVGHAGNRRVGDWWRRRRTPPGPCSRCRRDWPTRVSRAGRRRTGRPAPAPPPRHARIRVPAHGRRHRRGRRSSPACRSRCRAPGRRTRRLRDRTAARRHPTDSKVRRTG